MLYSVFAITFDSDLNITDFDTFEEANSYAHELVSDPDLDVIYIDINNGDDIVNVKM